MIIKTAPNTPQETYSMSVKQQLSFPTGTGVQLQPTLLARFWAQTITLEF